MSALLVVAEIKSFGPIKLKGELDDRIVVAMLIRQDSSVLIGLEVLADDGAFFDLPFALQNLPLRTELWSIKRVGDSLGRTYRFILCKRPDYR